MRLEKTLNRFSLRKALQTENLIPIALTALGSTLKHLALIHKQRKYRASSYLEVDRLVISIRKIAVAIWICIAFIPTRASAGLFEGVVDALHGFPEWYQDASGLVLEPCLDLTGACGPPDEVPTTFPSPVFYWVAEARMYTYGGKGGNPDATRPGGQATATLRMELMGTFPLDANGDRTPIAGSQLVLQSLQIRIDSLRDQALYTVTTPFGVFADIPANVAFDSNGDRTRNVDSIKETFQLPADPILPGNFDQSAFPTSPYSTASFSFSGMDRFLTCAGGPQASGFLGPVAVILGEPTLLECTIEGSPLGPAFDVFRIEGPEVGGGPLLWAELSGTPFAIGLDPWVAGEPSIDMIETTQFQITGQLGPARPVPALGTGALIVIVALLLLTGQHLKAAPTSKTA